MLAKVEGKEGAGRLYGRILALTLLVWAPLPLLLDEPQGDFFQLFHLLLPAEVAACPLLIVCLIHRPAVRPGEGFVGIVLGMSGIVILEALNLVYYSNGLIPFETFRILAPATYSLLLGVMLRHLWRPSFATEDLRQQASGLETRQAAR